MSSNTPQNIQDQEIDLAQVSKKIGGMYDSFLNGVFRFILFIKRNIIILAVLFILGAVLGWVLDRSTKVYEHEIVVIPNFGSSEYLYSKVNLIEAKIKERDKAFLGALGFDQKKIASIKIEPITDIYNFVNGDTQNFELIKLMAENGDIDKIIQSETTSLNYKTHKITIVTDGESSKKQILEPLLKFFNDSDYYKLVQKSVVASMQNQIDADERTIAQIDSLLSEFSSKASGAERNDKLVYYNENTQLNDVLLTKTNLLQQVANRKVELINTTSIVRESSSVLNMKNTKAVNGKMKFVLPILFVLLFMMFFWFRNFYKKRSARVASN